LNLPIFASSIYWDYSFVSTSRIAKVLGIKFFISDLYMNFMLFLIKITAFVFNKPQNISRGFRHNLKYFINKATCVLPNSAEEANLLLSFTKLNSSLLNDKFRVVLNAVEFGEERVELSKSDFLKKWNIPDNYILQVGRVEYTKNQLNLITALMDRSDIPLVFVGKVVEFDYYERIKKIAKKRGNVYFIDFVPHKEISTFYKYAKLHVLLSLRESPGLVNLEALKNGCPIVIPDQRFLPVDTYFSGQPYIVNPFDIVNVKQTVIEAYEKGAKIKFDIDKFSWKNTSKDTYSAYIEFMGNRN